MCWASHETYRFVDELFCGILRDMGVPVYCDVGPVVDGSCVTIIQVLGRFHVLESYMGSIRHIGGEWFNMCDAHEVILNDIATQERGK